MDPFGPGLHLSGDTLSQSEATLRRAARAGDLPHLFFEAYAAISTRARASRRDVGLSRSRLVEEAVAHSGVSLNVLTPSGRLLAPASGHDPETVGGLVAVLAPVSDGGAWQVLKGLPPHSLRYAPSERRSLLEEAVDAAFSLDERVTRVEATLMESLRQTSVVLPESAPVREQQYLPSLRVLVKMEGAGLPTVAHAIGSTETSRSPAEVARDAVRQALAAIAAGPLRAGTMPVIIAGGWGGVWLHEAAGHLFEADVAGRADERLATPEITLVDDPTLPDGRASYLYDDEGTPAARTVLLDKGRPFALLTDRYLARELGIPATGNGRRQHYARAPLPRMSNLILLPGSADPADLVASVADGLYVTGVEGGAVNPQSGIFSFTVVEGFRIQSGRITSSIGRCTLSARAAGFLRRVRGVGSDFKLERDRGLCEKRGQVVSVSVGSPTVLIDGMEVSFTT